MTRPAAPPTDTRPPERAVRLRADAAVVRRADARGNADLHRLCRTRHRQRSGPQQVLPAGRHPPATRRCGRGVAVGRRRPRTDRRGRARRDDHRTLSVVARTRLQAGARRLPRTRRTQHAAARSSISSRSTSADSTTWRSTNSPDRALAACWPKAYTPRGLRTRCQTIGFQLFQGLFFARPETVASQRRLTASQANLIELDQPGDPRFGHLPHRGHHQTRPGVVDQQPAAYRQFGRLRTDARPINCCATRSPCSAAASCSAGCSSC